MLLGRGLVRVSDQDPWHPAPVAPVLPVGDVDSPRKGEAVRTGLDPAPGATHTIDFLKYDPNQPRDEKGRWTDAGGGVSPSGDFNPAGNGPISTSSGDPLGGYLTVDKVDLDTVEAIQETYEGEWGGLRSQVTALYGAEDGGMIHVVGHVLDEDDEVVGEFVRDIFPTEGNVQHTSLTLSSQAQGRGFAKGFLSQSEAHYRAQGIEEIYLQTAEIGGYAWAKAGFDFNNEGDGGVGVPYDVRSGVEYTVDLLRRGADYTGITATMADVDRTALVAQGEAMLRAFDDGKHISANTIARWGEGFDVIEDENTHLPNVSMVHPGAKAMLYTSWDGVKRLDPVRKTAVFLDDLSDEDWRWIERACSGRVLKFDPNQPRDDIGRWTAGWDRPGAGVIIAEKPKWSPTMTRENAEHWAKDSKIQQVLTHTTPRDSLHAYWGEGLPANADLVHVDGEGWVAREFAEKIGTEWVLKPNAKGTGILDVGFDPTRGGGVFGPGTYLGMEELRIREGDRDPETWKYPLEIDDHQASEYGYGADREAAPTLRVMVNVDKPLYVDGKDGNWSDLNSALLREGHSITTNPIDRIRELGYDAIVVTDVDKEGFDWQIGGDQVVVWDKTKMTVLVDEGGVPEDHRFRKYAPGQARDEKGRFTDDLITALNQWKNTAGDARLATGSVISGGDPNATVPAARQEQLTAALIREVRDHGQPIPTLYRGTNAKQRKRGDGRGGGLTSWTTDRNIAQGFANGYDGMEAYAEGGQVHELLAGSAKGIRLADYNIGDAEDEWIVDLNTATDMPLLKYSPNQPRDNRGRFAETARAESWIRDNYPSIETLPRTGGHVILRDGSMFTVGLHEDAGFNGAKALGLTNTHSAGAGFFTRDAGAVRVRAMGDDIAFEAGTRPITSQQRARIVEAADGRHISAQDNRGNTTGLMWAPSPAKVNEVLKPFLATPDLDAYADMLKYAPGQPRDKDGRFARVLMDDGREVQIVAAHETPRGIEFEDTLGKRWPASKVVSYKPVEKYDPNQPRDDHGRWTDGLGTVHTGNVDVAVGAVLGGHRVVLDERRKVAVLLDKLRDMVAQARALGIKAPTYDLCKVTVKGTNLFCGENKNLPRSAMPQLKGVPTPGSRADKMARDERGEVSLNDEFRRHLLNKGVLITDENIPAAWLKATQRELNGGKVAEIAKAYEDGKLARERLFISGDEYIIDGHHRWASILGVDLADNVEGDHLMEVAQVHMPVLDLIAEANQFANDWGIPQAGLGTGFSPTMKAETLDPFGIVEKYDPNQPRDDAGRWTDSGYAYHTAGDAVAVLQAKMPKALIQGMDLLDGPTRAGVVKGLSRMADEWPEIAKDVALVRAGSGITEGIAEQIITTVRHPDGKQVTGNGFLIDTDKLSEEAWRTNYKWVNNVGDNAAWGTKLGPSDWQARGNTASIDTASEWAESMLIHEWGHAVHNRSTAKGLNYEKPWNDDGTRNEHVWYDSAQPGERFNQMEPENRALQDYRERAPYLGVDPPSTYAGGGHIGELFAEAFTFRHGPEGVGLYGGAKHLDRDLEIIVENIEVDARA